MVCASVLYSVFLVCVRPSAWLTQCSQSLQLFVIVGAVGPSDLEDLVLAVAAGLAQQCPVATWNPRRAHTKGFTKRLFNSTPSFLKDEIFCWLIFPHIKDAETIMRWCCSEVTHRHKPTPTNQWRQCASPTKSWILITEDDASCWHMSWPGTDQWFIYFNINIFPGGWAAACCGTTSTHKKQVQELRMYKWRVLEKVWVKQRSGRENKARHKLRRELCFRCLPASRGVLLFSL